MTSPTVSEKLHELLLSDGSADFDQALRLVADDFAAVTATLHRADSSTRMLHMVAHLGLPPQLVPITQQIPFGKGIAGLCAEKVEPITLCNLQTDTSGAARPSAKQTGVAGAIAVPVLGPDRTLIGTLGVGKPGEHTYTDDELRTLDGYATLFGKALSKA